MMCIIKHVLINYAKIQKKKIGKKRKKYLSQIHY